MFTHVVREKNCQNSPLRSHTRLQEKREQRVGRINYLFKTVPFGYFNNDLLNKCLMQYFRQQIMIMITIMIMIMIMITCDNSK